MFYSKKGNYIAKEVIELANKKAKLLQELEKIQKKLDKLL
jgi:hypothetical protein